MRFFLAFCLLIAGALLVGVLIAQPLADLIQSLISVSADRLVHRLALIVALLGLPWLLKRYDAWDRTILGFGSPPMTFLRSIAKGIFWGAIIILPVLALQLVLGIREWDLAYTNLLDKFLKTLKLACISGITVALVEEFFFRGALQGGMMQEGAARIAILLSSFVYAALHFVQSTPGRSTSPWGHGLNVLAHSFDQFLMPGQIVDSLAALFTAGVLLALVRWRTGSIAMSIGIHAGWVAIIKLGKQFTDPIKDAPLAGLIGDYDGVTGWLAFLWLGAVAIAFWIYLEKNSPGITRPRPSSGK